MRVCLHCAEELSDDATACTMCGKDPTVAPAPIATTSARIPSWSSTADRPSTRTGTIASFDPVEDVSQPLAQPLEGLEPDTARIRPVPPAVWWSFALALVGGVGAFVLPIAAGLVFAIAGHLSGAALGAIARRAINDSGGRLRGSAAVQVAIALNLVQLVLTLFALGPLLPTSFSG
jgi:hypothetical protein